MSFFHHKLRRDDFQAPGNILADVTHLPLALGTNTFVFRQDFMNDLNLDIFRQYFLGGTACLTRMRFLPCFCCCNYTKNRQKSHEENTQKQVFSMGFSPN
jgi:hypothetical protein